MLLPSFRSFLGDRSTDGQYENIASLEFKEAWKKHILGWTEKIHGHEKEVDLDTRTLMWILANERRLLPFPDEWMLLTSYDNPILQFVIEDRHIYPLRTRKDGNNLISRTRARIRLIQDMVHEMRQGVEMGYTIPRSICQKTIQQLDAFLASRSYDFPFPKRLTQMKAAYAKVLDAEYVPTLQELSAFLKGHEPHCRRSIGLCYVKNGKDMYRSIVRSCTTLEITPEEIHAYGKQEMARLYRNLASFQKDLLQAMNITWKGRMTHRELFQKILSRESEYYSSSRAILHAYREAQARIRRTILPKYFEKGIEGYHVQEIPSLLRDSTPGAYYEMPTGTHPGTVFLNTGSKRNPTYTVDVLSLHEGAPGHHYQYQYMKQHRVPLYRMYTADNTAYTEGWALYAEGFLETRDPKPRFGRWIYDMLRAVRLVVDTGIHFYGWSYKKALAYLQRHVPLSEEERKMELDHYICDPGQALGYKIGERFFYTERDHFLKQGGSIQEFHRRVLECGPLPLEVLQWKLRHSQTCQNQKQ